MKKLVLVVALLLVCGIAYPMAWEWKEPKGITLRNKTGDLFSLKDYKNYAVSYLEVCDFWGLTLNGGLATDIDKTYGVVSVMYDLKNISDIYEACPPTSIIVKPIKYLNDLATKIPFIELEVGAYLGYEVSGDFQQFNSDKIDYGVTATIVKMSW